MGNSISVDNEQPDSWWPPGRTHITVSEQTTETTQSNENTISVTINPEITAHSSNTNEENNDDRNINRKLNEKKLQQFKSDLEKKHLARREAIAERSREILFLREELIKYKKENEQLKDLLKQNVDLDEQDLPEQDIEEVKSELEQMKNENEELQNKISQLNEELSRSDAISKQNQDLRKSIAETQNDLQAVNAQVIEFENQRHEYDSHVVALKDVINVSKRLLEIRENQLREVKSKVAEIETSLAEREVSMMSQNLKDEYERQLENIRNLRALYEQRQAATKAEKDLMASRLTDAKNILETEQKKNGELEERIGELENNVSDKYDEIKSLESQLGLAKAEFRGLETEMSAINQLFSQILYGFNNCQEIDFDKLIHNLEENHDLLTNIVINEESESISSVLPKVLLDLVNQVNEENKSADLITETDESTLDSCSGSDIVPEEIQQPEQQSGNTMNSAEEIVNKLPKVWRVLTELLRQQSGLQPVDIKDDGTDPCYKSVETPKGPKMVLSVSQTFIRLKDLILEKKSLEKEMSRLKHLNTHLEVRLQDQEKRLETVSSELSKTWHVVGRMQRQHQQLHTHEKILRYELAQKRKMLTELKEELEYCREKWVQAREKNSNTEEEWKKLRTEFAARKTTVVDELNNSAESGYSDEREGSSDEEYNTEKRNKKLMNKIPVNEQASDTDDTDCNSHSTAEETNPAKIEDMDTKIENLEAMIDNQGQAGNIQITEEPGKSNECEDKLHSTVEQKTDFEVQNQSEKTIPASLDMIDNVIALGIVPVNVSNDSSHSHSFEETPSTSSNKDKVQNQSLKTVPASLDMIDNVCAFETVPFTVSGISSHSSEETSSTDKEISRVEVQNENIDMIDNTLETVPVIVPEISSYTYEETSSTNSTNSSTPTDEVINQNEKIIPASLDLIDNVCALGTVPVTVPVSSYNSKESSSTLTDKETNHDETQNQSLKTAPASIDLIDTVPVAVPVSSYSCEELSSSNSTDKETNQDEVQTESHNTAPASIDMIDTVCALGTIPVAISEETPSTSSRTTPTDRELIQDERLKRREERLKRLEEQCQQLVTKVTNTTHRSTQIYNRLETLHEQYGNDSARANAETPAEESENAENDPK